MSLEIQPHSTSRKLSRQGVALPGLFAAADEETQRSFLEFFLANIRNSNTREAYGRAIGAFGRWCEEREITNLFDVDPILAAA